MHLKCNIVLEKLSHFIILNKLSKSNSERYFKLIDLVLKGKGISAPRGFRENTLK